jgi:hypothetical protein
LNMWWCSWTAATDAAAAAAAAVARWSATSCTQARARASAANVSLCAMQQPLTPCYAPSHIESCMPISSVGPFVEVLAHTRATQSTNAHPPSTLAMHVLVPLSPTPLTCQKPPKCSMHTPPPPYFAYTTRPSEPNPSVGS